MASKSGHTLLGDTPWLGYKPCPCMDGCWGPGEVSWGGTGGCALPHQLPEPHRASMPAGEHEWKLVSTGITDCYFNVTELPPGSTPKFRVACVNKAGQGPFSTPSGKVHLEAVGEQKPFHGAAPTASSGMWGWLWGCSPCCPHPVPGSRLPFLPADSRAAPAKDVAVPVPDKVASSRSTQTPQAQLEPPAVGLPPTTPPRKHKAALQQPERPPQAGVPGGPRPDPELPPNITVCEPPELVFTPPRTAAVLQASSPARGSPMDTSTPASPTQGSPQPRAPSPSKSSPAPPASTTSNAAPPRKMPPYMVTSFVSMPPASPPAQEAPTSAPSSKEPPADSGAPDGTALRQGVPQKPYTFLDEKAR